jgi:hypothetical protein
MPAATRAGSTPIDLGRAALSVLPIMAKDFIGYQALTDAALRGVVREALHRIEKSGLIGAHHFYLTFKTHADGVDIPDFLREQYPDEMTIIIQHQYWALKVKEDFFEVTLTFKKLPAPLHIPFSALTAFFDPGVQFGLQFRTEGDKAAAGPGPVGVPTGQNHGQNHGQKHGQDQDQGSHDGAEGSAGEDAGAAIARPPEKSAPGEVVSLDSFRKK